MIYLYHRFECMQCMCIPHYNVDTVALGFVNEDLRDISEDTIYTAHGKKMKVTFMARIVWCYT